MNAVAALLVGLSFGWTACYVLIARTFRRRAEWWLRAYAEGQQPIDPRRPW